MTRPTETQKQQNELVEKISVMLQAFSQSSPHQNSALLELWRHEHANFCLKGLEHLSPGYCVLDSSRPWLCYWMLHSLAILGEPLDVSLEKRVVDFLSHCQDPEGGYCGGPGQLPHLATTYAAVFALVTIGGDEALASINREKMLNFLLRMKDSSGGFRMHTNGEIDVRGCYTAIVVAYILNILSPALVDGVAEYISSCQSYEGGIGGEPGAEAHGGYTYCGVAALVLIDQVNHLDLRSLVNWAVFRQGKIEGGFQGRINKLVDGCYSFWQGGIFPIFQRLSGHLNYPERHTEESPTYSALTSVMVNSENSSTGAVSAASLFPALNHAKFRHATCESDDESGSDDSCCELEECRWGPLFNPHALQAYILLCCQDLAGGLRDKPGKPRDYYHTCYCLSGLSVAQYSWSRTLNVLPLPSSVLGPFDNLLEPTHPLCNVVLDKYNHARRYFSSTKES